MPQLPIQNDVWSEWLLKLRHADDDAQRLSIRQATTEIADRVIDGTRLTPTSRLIDMGSGDGLVAFRAIERFGRDLQVIFTDVSEPLLAYVEATAAERGCSRQCTFVQASAKDMSMLPSSIADAVTSRAVLAYEADKPRAFSEIFRLLKPGAMLSIAEPVLRDEALATAALRTAVAQTANAPSADVLLPLIHKWKSAQYPDTFEKIAANPLTNYNERTLVQMATDAGFTDVHMQLTIRTISSSFTSWDSFISGSPHPLAPSLAEILDTAFSADERALFELWLRPTIESGSVEGLDRVIYMTARKPI